MFQAGIANTTSAKSCSLSLSLSPFFAQNVEIDITRALAQANAKFQLKSVINHSRSGRTFATNSLGSPLMLCLCRPRTRRVSNEPQCVRFAVGPEPSPRPPPLCLRSERFTARRFSALYLLGRIYGSKCVRIFRDPSAAQCHNPARNGTRSDALKKEQGRGGGG